MMYYKGELQLMVHSTVKFGQNMAVCHKLIYKTKFRMQTIQLKDKCLHYDGLKDAL